MRFAVRIAVSRRMFACSHMLPWWTYPLDHRHDLITRLSLDMLSLAEGTPSITHLVPIHTVPCMNKCINTECTFEVVTL